MCVQCLNVVVLSHGMVQILRLSGRHRNAIKNEGMGSEFFVRAVNSLLYGQVAVRIVWEDQQNLS